MKFSIVIPTLQKNIRVLNILLKQLIDEEYIDEIILIDNSLQGLNIESDKLKVIIPSENLFVNPAWNRGVREANNKYIGLVNDDIIFPRYFFSNLVNFIKNNELFGIIGLDTLPNTNPEEFDNIPTLGELNFIPVDERCACFGCAMFFEKENYNEIPEEMKVWFGDDYIFDKTIQNNLINYKIENSNIKHLHSNTSKLPEFDVIKEKDMLAYMEFNPEYKDKMKLKPLSLFEKIFSIRNEFILTQKYKILTIFGIRITLKKERV